jgi:hypothetical protein
MINQFDFANENKIFNKENLADYQIFMIDAVTSVMSHGDVEEFERVFLVAAPTQEHAKTWVELHYLLDSVSNSHQELIEEIKENTIQDDETDSIDSRFVGHLSVGDYKYRSIDRILEITRGSASQTLMLGNYYQTNLEINALN